MLFEFVRPMNKEDNLLKTTHGKLPGLGDYTGFSSSLSMTLMFPDPQQHLHCDG